MMKWENRNRISMGYLHRAMHRSKHQNQLIIYVRFDIQTYIVCAFNATCFQCANCQHVYSLTFSLVLSLKVGSKNVNRHYIIKIFPIVLITHSLMVHVSLFTSITKYVNYLRINVWEFNSNSVLWTHTVAIVKPFFSSTILIGANFPRKNNFQVLDLLTFAQVLITRKQETMSQTEILYLTLKFVQRYI